MLTDQQITAALEICKKATPGEWVGKRLPNGYALPFGDKKGYQSYGPFLIRGVREDQLFDDSWRCGKENDSNPNGSPGVDIDFIVAARSEKTGWPAALREVQRLRKQLEAAMLALKHTAPLSPYADELASAGMVYDAHAKALRVTSRKANEAITAIAALEDET